MNQLATLPPALRRRLARPLAALGLLLATAGTAQAQTTSFAYTGSPQTYTVPAGVTRLQVVATGAAGGTTNTVGTRAGGLGARVQATVAVTPGETLTVLIGGQGLGAAGGYNGGGSSEGIAGSGGGELRTCAAPMRPLQARATI